MKTYKFKLTFSNFHRGTIQAHNLDAVHQRIVAYMNNHTTVTKCDIICENGVQRRVIKTGGFHWKHNGYAFD